MDRDDRVLMLLGEVRGDIRGLTRQSERMEAQGELVRIALERQGTAIASLPCAVHRKRISDLYKHVGVVEETTGRIQLAEIEREAQRRMWRKIGRALWDTKAWWLPLIVGAIVAAAGLAAAR